MRMIFVNLPVRDLEASKRFFGALGFAFEPNYTDDEAACMIVERNIYVMLLSQARFLDFVVGPIGDPAQETHFLTALSVDRRQEVDDMIARALAAGAKAWLPPVDHGRMYMGSFQDPDGHVWELVWMAAPDA